jgi:hypothetical protein
MSAQDYLACLGVTPSMSRMPQMANPNTIGPSFHTPTQADFRQTQRGFDGYPADPQRRDTQTGMSPAHANCGRLTRRPDGSVEAVRLEATGDGWIDTGGQTPRDMKVVNW